MAGLYRLNMKHCPKFRLTRVNLSFRSSAYRDECQSE